MSDEAETLIRAVLYAVILCGAGFLLSLLLAVLR